MRARSSFSLATRSWPERSQAFMPVALFPQVSFPRVRITLDSGDRPAERMADRSDDAGRGSGPRHSGSAQLEIDHEPRHRRNFGQFRLGRRHGLGHASMPVAGEQILPASAVRHLRFEVERIDPTVFPVIAYSLTSDSHSLVELRDLALYTLRPALSTVSGVARVSIQGGRVEEYRVTSIPINCNRLR